MAQSSATHRASERRGFGVFNLRTVTSWLITLNILVFVLDPILLKMGYVGHRDIGLDPRTNSLAYKDIPLLNWWGYFSAQTTLELHQWWRLISFQFLHANVIHLMMNMLGLMMMGPFIESYLGSRRFLCFYLLCGGAGAAAYLFFWKTGILDYPAYLPLIGASAGVFGILAGVARLAPNHMVELLFPPVTVKMKELAIVLMGVAAVTIFTQGQNAGGEAGHLGGAVLGLLIVKMMRGRPSVAGG